jgi:2-dehydro-3-deoxyphosphogluconate aldolase/(4S)-4-hydroxy-2-oxoglutarate aldolase
VAKIRAMPKKHIEQPSVYKETIELIEKGKIFLLLTGNSVKSIIEASQYAKENGFSLIGIDFQIPGIKDSLKSLKRRGQRNLGVFSISTKKEAKIAINAGAVFVFSTHLDRGIIRRCKKESVFHAIGSLTPTEVFSAHDLRADAISLFPCGKMGGLSWFAFLKSIFPRIKFIPTDIMSPFEASEYLISGAYAVAPIINLETTKELQKLIEGFLMTRNLIDSMEM